MRVFDYLQGEIRDIKEINILSNGEHELIYNNEIVKRRRYEFRFLDKAYECIEGFFIEKCDDNGFCIENAYEEVRKGSLWFTPEEDTNYRFVGGEVRLESANPLQWIEITKEHLGKYFKEI